MNFKPLDGWREALSSWGWIIPTGGLLALVLFLMVGLPEVGVDTTPTSSDGPTFVAATGAGGFPVEEFCNDPLTSIVGPVAAPDASGFTYQLNRVRDGVTETVVVVVSEDQVLAGTHYFDGEDGQESEPAFLTEKARECLDADR